jgi:hypothetical protein
LHPSLNPNSLVLVCGHVVVLYFTAENFTENPRDLSHGCK